MPILGQPAPRMVNELSLFDQAIRFELDCLFQAGKRESRCREQGG